MGAAVAEETRVSRSAHLQVQPCVADSHDGIADCFWADPCESIGGVATQGTLASEQPAGNLTGASHSGGTMQKRQWEQVVPAHP